MDRVFDRGPGTTSGNTRACAPSPRPTFIHQHMWAQKKPRSGVWVSSSSSEWAWCLRWSATQPIGPAFRGTGSDDRQDIFEPPGPQREAAMSQQAMIGHADPDPAGQPVQEEAQGQARPGKISRDKREQGTERALLRSRSREPRPAVRRGLRGGRCRHDQPLVLIIAEDGFVVVGGPSTNRRDARSRLTRRTIRSSRQARALAPGGV